MWSLHCGQWAHNSRDTDVLGTIIVIASNNIRNISSYFYANSNYFETYNNQFIKYVFYSYSEIQHHVNNEFNGMHVCLFVRWFVFVIV